MPNKEYLQTISEARCASYKELTLSQIEIKLHSALQNMPSFTVEPKRYEECAVHINQLFVEYHLRRVEIVLAYEFALDVLDALNTEKK